jgi:hypothetical protein
LNQKKKERRRKNWCTTIAEEKILNPIIESNITETSVLVFEDGSALI